ncbi:MAG TPA: polyketide synthase, partial [Pyrinomonadaceae bacterium]
MSNTEKADAVEGLAVIGLWGRFPGAENVEEFWRNLRDGVESVSFFSDEELRAAGVDPAHLDSNHVRAKGVLADVELFDAAFFGINPREAEIMDPQHRVFLEGAWAALESAGYNPEKYEGSIGVYAGPNINSYFLFNLFSNLDVLRQYGFFETTIRSRPDLLTTQVSYKLNLRGPSMSIQTACSTSLVAVHVACQGLLNGECDMALAGGISIGLPQTSGYTYQEGGILSPDGHCRAFDATAQGTVFGNGAGIVVLKRLADALADGDTVHAVIKGSAVNNDGSLKVGLTAPGLDGQAAVITEAQLVAGVEPETITYVETHGTGTALGDPIEIAALSRAFRSRTQRNNFCAIGSLKSNVGHLDTAAGVASLIKTVLALSHRQIPPSLHFEQPNPQIDFLNSPFFVNAELRDWEAALHPRRAGVSSFGIGGT